MLSGPLHPGFSELVEREIYYVFFNSIVGKEKRLDIRANEKDISKLVGIKKANKERLKEYFNIKIDNGIEKGKVVINDRMYSRLDILRKEINESDSN